MVSDERLRELEDKYDGYTVYDDSGAKIGKVDDLFVDEADSEEYIGVRMGLFGLSGTTLIPMEIARADEANRRIEVSATKERVKDAPNFRDDDDVTSEYEARIRSHFGLGEIGTGTAGGSYGEPGAAGAGAAGVGAAGTRGTGDREDHREDRRSGQAQGGVEDKSAEGGREGGDADLGGRYSGAVMGGTQDKERAGDYDEEPGADEGRESMGREDYRNREPGLGETPTGGAGAHATSSTGGVSDLETGERGAASGLSGEGGEVRQDREGFDGPVRERGTEGQRQGAGTVEGEGWERVRVRHIRR